MLRQDREPLVSILVVTWNRRAELERSLRSALVQTYPFTELVVVDNGSTDGSAEHVAVTFPGARLVRLPANVGCPSGRNAGFTHCRGKYIYQLDDDGWLQEDAVERAVMRAEADDRIAVVMSQVRETDEEGRMRVRPAGTEPRFVFTFSGGCSMLRRAALEEVGPYPDDFFRQGEEADLALRIYDRGYTCVFEPTSVMYHRPSPLGRSPNATLRYSLRNTNKTGLRLWPFPWCVLRPMVTGVHACAQMLSRRYWALPAQLALDLLRDLRALRETRRPVSHDTLRLCRALQAHPADELTIRGSRHVIEPLPQRATVEVGEA
jgi:GT2 family glycosyltransferase